MESEKSLQHLTDWVETCLLTLEKEFCINPNVGMVLLWVATIEQMSSKFNIEDWVTLSRIGDRSIINKLLKVVANPIDDSIILLSLKYNAPEWSDVQKLASVKLRNMAVWSEFNVALWPDELKQHIYKLKRAMHWNVEGAVSGVADRLLYDLTFEVDKFSDEEKIKACGSVEAFDEAHPIKTKHNPDTMEWLYNKLSEEGGLRPALKSGRQK